MVYAYFTKFIINSANEYIPKQRLYLTDMLLLGGMQLVLNTVKQASHCMQKEKVTP